MSMVPVAGLLPSTAGVFSMTDTVLLASGEDDVGPAVAVQVRHHHRMGRAAGGEGLLGGEAEGGGARCRRVQQHRHACSRQSLATMRSGRPSPFTSATTTESGALPVAKVCWAAKLGVVAPGAVVFSSTDTVLRIGTVGDDEVGGRPSPFRSDTRHRSGIAAGGEGLRGRRTWRWSRLVRSCPAAPIPCWTAGIGEDEVRLSRRRSRPPLANELT